MAHNPKILLIHDWLNTKDGGAEAVLYALLAIYPEADVATLIYNRRMFGARLSGRRIQTSFLQRFPSFLKRRPHLLLPWIKQAVENIDTTGYDIVIAASSAWVKNVSLQEGQRCLVYCHSPARMLWDSWPAALNHRTRNGLVRLYVTWLASRLRLWDYYESQDKRREFVANSQTVANRITKFYHRDAQVIVPPVTLPPTVAAEKEKYWIVVSVLSEYKNIALAIETCKRRKERLLIVGDGPDRQRLEGIAGGSEYIEFRGRVDEQEKWRLVAAARGFLFCSVEDFGIAPVESLGCGTPVVGLRAGGLTETIQDGKTGILYAEPTVEDLDEAMSRCMKHSWQARTLRRAAQAYSPEIFRQRVVAVVGVLRGSAH